MTFAFVPVVAKSEAVEIETKPELPAFKRRWWYSDGRLDARPVIWSLNNRPDEWRRTYLCVLHLPSQHEFWGHDAFSSGLWRADCSCHLSATTKFQLGQSFFFRRAVRRWINRQRPEAETVAAQFASHFIR